MGVEEEFRKNAERCRLMAEGSAVTADKAFWLLLAENWELILATFKLPEQNGSGPVWALRAAFPTTANSSERAGAVARCRSLSTIRRQL